MGGSIERSRGKAPYRRAAAASVLKPVNSVLPAISGTAQVGATLTATNGTWTHTPTYARQWMRDGVPIAGATATTHVLVDDDEGAVISMVVTATKGGFRAVAKSATTDEIAAAA